MKSALSQDLAPSLHEIIIVNDSGKPLPNHEWLNDPQIKIVNTNCSERSIACNVGAAIAVGTFIKILHDDDYLLPGALNALIKAAESFRSIWTYGALNRVDNEDHFISLNHPMEKGNLFALLVTGECFHPSASLIDRKAFFEVGGFDPLLKVREDYDLECRLALIGNFGYTDEVVANVRIGREGGTTKWEDVSREHRIAREKALNLKSARQQLVDLTRHDTFLRGRVCRAYLASAIYNLNRRHIFNSVSRLTSIIQFTGYHFIFQRFWSGLFYKDYWHQVARYKEEAFFSRSKDAEQPK